MPTILPVHILAGLLALVFGYVALFARKGATLHRKSGRLFVGAIVAMSLSGALIAALKGSRVSVVAGVFTFYFVTTALFTVRRRPQDSQWIVRAAMLLALAVAALAFKTGFELLESGRPETGPMFVFGVVGVLAAAGDARVLRAGGIQGPRRIARHLWRMCFAMWVAAASFFWGPRGRVPEAIRVPPLLAIVVLLPIVVMFYWLWRVRVTRKADGMWHGRAPAIAAAATAGSASVSDRADDATWVASGEYVFRDVSRHHAAGANHGS
jgi:uncharacterized membrane protein